MEEQDLTYFKDLIEGNADVSWRAWFKENEDRLAATLSRVLFLKLKFQNVEAARELLDEAGISYSISRQFNREKHYALLDPDSLDSRGRPIVSEIDKGYNGAVGDFREGRIEEASRKLDAFLRRAMRSEELDRSELISDFSYDAEMEFELGDEAFGRLMLEKLAAIDVDDDLIDLHIESARELLE